MFKNNLAGIMIKHTVSHLASLTVTDAVFDIWLFDRQQQQPVDDYMWDKMYDMSFDHLNWNTSMAFRQILNLIAFAKL